MTKDPTKDPDFKKVVQTFLHTKPQPHKPAAKRRTIKARTPATKAKRGSEQT